MSDSIQLQTSSILQVPFSKYSKDFTFIVNGEEFHTNQIIADILSPKISQMRNNDPTFLEFSINTQSKGDFQQILDLIDFKQHQITSNINLTFLIEILEQFENTSIDINYKQEEITIENVIDKIKEHENKLFYSKQYSEEVDFLSANFSILLNQQKEKLLTVSKYSLENIINNDKLTLQSEDELVSFINELYTRDRNHNFLYEYVIYSNIETKTMKEFIAIFDDNDLTRGSWKSISKRLMHEIQLNEETNDTNQRYTKPKKTFNEFSYSNKEFEGIINLLCKNSNIKDEINITFSSNSYRTDPFGLFNYENKTQYFSTNSVKDSWICFEFKNHRIIPKNYTIRSHNNGCTGHYNLKSWVIEGSLDSNQWENLSEVENTSVLDGKNFSHTFAIQNQSNREYKFIRIRITDKNSSGGYQLWMNTFEIYGKLI